MTFAMKQHPEAAQPGQADGPRSAGRSLRNGAGILAPAWAAVFVFLGAGAFAQDPDPKQELDQLKKTQAELIRLMQEQQKRIEELERKNAAGPVAAPTAEDKKKDDVVNWNEIVMGGSKIKFYGFIRLDAIYDDSRPNNTQTIFGIRSEDPLAPAGIGSQTADQDFTMHPRLTRFGVDFDGPVIEALGDAKVSGKLEIDFYNNGVLGQSESRQVPRLRHGFVKLGWDEVSVLAGQTTDIISPLFPIVNSDLVMWGAGNLGDRRPQVRMEYAPVLDEAGATKFILQTEIGLSGADDNSDIDAAGTVGAGYRDGETSGLPTYQLRAAIRHLLWEEKKQNFEVGIWGHRSWEESDTKFKGENDFESDAIGFDLFIPLYEDVVYFKAEGWMGQNLDDVRGGIFQGINTVGGEEIGSRGGFVEMGFRPVDFYQFAIGFAMDDPVDSNLPVAARSSNHIFYLGNRFYFDPVEFGFDYMNWTTDYIGFDEGDDNRFQMYVQYKF